ncbi:hypothetical protein [Salinispira pacifica]
MNRKSIILSALWTLLCLAPLQAQEIQPAKIPQRVYFEPVPGGLAAQNPVLRQLPDYLYTAIAAIQPIVRVDDRAQANSAVTVVPGDGGLVLELGAEDGSTEREVLANPEDDRLIAQAVERAARRFAPHLGLVEPKVVRVAGPEAASTASMQQLVETVRTRDRYALPFELTVRGAGILAFSGGGGTNDRREAAWNGLPASVDLGWYITRTFGLVGSVWTYYGEDLTFGRQANTGGPGYVRAFLILPGVGVSYRTLGNFFTEFSVVAYAGYGYITNITPNTIGRKDDTGGVYPFLAPDESISILYPLLSFSADFGYNISQHLAVQARVGIEFTPAAIWGNSMYSFNSFAYPTDGSDVYFRLLTIGLTYRF